LEKKGLDLRKRKDVIIGCNQVERCRMARKAIRVGFQSQVTLNTRQQTEANGFRIGMQDGEVVLQVQMPGAAAAQFTREGISQVLSVLDREIPEGDDPGSVFAQTASVDETGALSGQFSREKRARKVTIPAEDLGEMRDLFAQMLRSFDGWAEELTSQAPAVEEPPAE